MTLTSLTVRNFRNIASLDVTIPERGVVIVGANGQGKTNFLEAIYYLVLFRSLRNAKDRALVRFGQPGFFVGADAGVRVTAGFEVEGRRKKITVDGGPVQRLADAVGSVLAVPFSPADREIVSGGPGQRRRYLDILLALSDRGYLRNLAAMRSALKQRNAALRRGQPAVARAFDGPLARAGGEIARRRLRWAADWNGRFTELCEALGERQQVALTYRGHGWDAGGTEKSLWGALEAARDRDLRRGTTTVGPQRDELRLELGGRDLRSYGSAGQQRTAGVALRLLEAENLASATGRSPIGLYDDVFAELDQDRQGRLLHLLRHTLPGQAVVTAPRESEVPADLYDGPRWYMREGQLVTT